MAFVRAPRGADRPRAARPSPAITRPMRTRNWSAALLAATLAVSACSDATPVAPALTATPRPQEVGDVPAVRISELHYDNTGTDAGEAIEISGPAGTSLEGCRLPIRSCAVFLPGEPLCRARPLPPAAPAGCPSPCSWAPHRLQP